MYGTESLTAALTRKISLAALLIAFSVTKSYATEMAVKSAHVPSEIGSLAITTIHRDKQGVQWIGTQTGLYRFDGISLTRYSPNSPPPFRISQSHIQLIDEDISGNLVVITSGGRILIQSKLDSSFSEVSIPQLGPAVISKWLHIDGKLNLWIGTDHGLIVINPRTNSTPQWVKNSGILANIRSSSNYFNDGEGNLLILGRSSIFRIDLHNETWSEFRVEPKNTAYEFGLTAITPIDSSRYLLALSSGHLGLLDLNSQSTMIGDQRVSTDKNGIKVFAKHPTGIIAATENSIYLFRNEILGNSPNIYPEYLSYSPVVHDLYAETDVIWVPTLDGLDIISSYNFEHFVLTKPGVDSSITSFGEDDQGNVWIGASSGIYPISNFTTKSYFTVDNQLPSNSDLLAPNPTAIQFTKNRMIAGYQTGQLELYSQSCMCNHPGTPPLLESSGIVAIKRDKDSSVWIATHRDGLYRISGDQLTSFAQNGGLTEKFIFWITEGKEGELLVGSSNKVYRYNPERDKFDLLQNIFGDKTDVQFVMSALITVNGDAWFGTEDYGLYRWPALRRSDALQTLSKSGAGTDYQSDTIYSIQADRSGNLWMSTQRGLVKTDSEGNFIWRFGPGDGLQGLDFQWGAAFTASDGAMYFGGSNGFNRFYPDKVVIDRTPPKTILSKIHFPEISYLNFRKAPDRTNVEVTHKDRFVTFEMGIINPKDSLNSRFRYRLDGFDPDWVNSGSRNTATYTNLPTGNYVFVAQGANTAGIWDPQGIRIPVKVLPPPWLSWWAYCLYTLAAGLALWATFRTYRSYVAEQQAEALRLEVQRTMEQAEEEMEEQLEYQQELLKAAYDHKKDTLGLIGTALSDSAESGRGAREGQDQSETNTSAVHALKLLEEYLFYTPDGPQANLHEFTEAAIEELLPSSTVDAQTVVTINDTPEHLISAEAASPLAILIFELVKNCLQHAFSPESPANYIEIRLSSKSANPPIQRTYTLKVADTGQGASANPFVDATPDSGASRVCAVAAAYAGTVDFENDSGASVTISITVDI